MNLESEKVTLAEVEQVYQKYKNDLWRFLVSLCRNSDEAADLFQGVFLKVVEKARDGYIQRATLRSFLFTLTYNHFIDSRRTRRWEQAGGDMLAATASSDQHADESARIAAVLLAALQDPQLPERTREILRLRYLCELTITDITRTLQVSRPTVYADLNHALAYLRREFEKLGLTPDLLREDG